MAGPAHPFLRTVGVFQPSVSISFKLESELFTVWCPMCLLQKTLILTLFRPAHIFRMKTKLARLLQFFPPFSQSIFHKRVQATHHGNWATFYICDEAIFRVSRQLAIEIINLGNSIISRLRLIGQTTTKTSTN